jgi:hypothetical protein
VVRGKKYPMVSAKPVVRPSRESLAREGISSFDEAGSPRSKEQEVRRIDEPHDHDVLFGRSTEAMSHPGTVRFRMLVLENRATYEMMDGYVNVDDCWLLRFHEFRLTPYG